MLVKFDKLFKLLFLKMNNAKSVLLEHPTSHIGDTYSTISHSKLV